MFSCFSHVLTLCDLMDYSLPGSLVHGILQARMLEWLPCPLPGDLSYPGTELASPASPALQVDSLPLCHLRSPSYQRYYRVNKSRQNLEGT